MRRMSRSIPLGASLKRRRSTASRVVGIMRITIEYIIAKIVKTAMNKNQNLETIFISFLVISSDFRNLPQENVNLFIENVQR